MSNHDPVFDQAEQLWRPQSERRRNAYDGSTWPNLTGRFGLQLAMFGSPFMRAAGDFVDAEMAARGSAILGALRDAHATVGSVRTRDWSKETFNTWSCARLREECDSLRALWSSSPGTPWADTRPAYLHLVAVSEDRETKLICALVAQHFATVTKSRISHWLGKLDPLKSVPKAWWAVLGVFGLLALSTLFPTVAEKIGALFGIH